MKLEKNSVRYTKNFELHPQGNGLKEEGRRGCGAGGVRMRWRRKREGGEGQQEEETTRRLDPK